MTRVLLLTVVPFFFPIIVYILWRTFAPLGYGGSEVIAQNKWERLPWRYLVPTGIFSVALSIIVSILFPDLFAETSSILKAR